MLLNKNSATHRYYLFESFALLGSCVLFTPFITHLNYLNYLNHLNHLYYLCHLNYLYECSLICTL